MGKVRKKSAVISAMAAGFWGMPKQAMIGIIMMCLVLAGVIIYVTRKPKSPGLEAFKGQLMWVKCNNPACKAEYPMDKQEYFKQMEEKARANPVLEEPPPLVCKKCGKPSLYRAIKCEKCGTVFFYGVAGPGDFADRCPNCKYSSTEARRKERLAERGR